MHQASKFIPLFLALNCVLLMRVNSYKNLTQAGLLTHIKLLLKIVPPLDGEAVLLSSNGSENKFFGTLANQLF